MANSYPTAILIRKKALVVNLEAIRMIICSDQVLVQSVPSPQNPALNTFPTRTSPFVRDLVQRLSVAAKEDLDPKCAPGGCRTLPALRAGPGPGTGRRGGARPAGHGGSCACARSQAAGALRCALALISSLDTAGRAGSQPQRVQARAHPHRHQDPL